MADSFWTLLQIDPTADEDDIRRAYARRLRDFRPDEDPQGFQRLVWARDAALAWASAQAVPIVFQDSRTSRTDADAAEPASTAQATAESGQSPIDVLDEPAVPPPLQTRAAEPAVAHDEEEPVFTRLHEIIGRGKRWPWASGVDPSAKEAKLWIELLDAAASTLNFERHEQFLDIAGSFVAAMLPGVPLQNEENLSDFAEGRGFAALTETIEQACRYAERPAKLGRLSGDAASLRYFSWLSYAQTARGILNRRKAGKPAYFDAQTGLPVFPAEDRAVVLLTTERGKFYEEAVKRKAWPSRFDWKTMLTPSARLAYAGLMWQSSLYFLALLLIALAGAALYDDIAQWAGLVSLPILLAARALMARRIDRLAVGAAIRRVMYADRHRLWHKARRLDHLRNNWRYFERYIFGAEILLTVIVGALIPVMLGSVLQPKDFLDRSVETTITETVATALEEAANSDQVRDAQIIELMNFLILKESTDFPGRARGEPLRLRDLRNRHWLTDLRSLGEDQFASTGSGYRSPIMATVAEERERKLRLIARDYRAGTPEQRIRIERRIVAWAPILLRAKGPQAIAAVWAAIPPRTEGPSFDAFPNEIRRQLLGDIAPSDADESTAKDVALIGSLNWLVTVPDDELRDIAPLAVGTLPNPTMPPVMVQGGPATDRIPPVQLDRSGGAETAAARYLSEHSGTALGLAGLSGLSHSDATVARWAYFDLIQKCFDWRNSDDFQHMRQVIAQSLADPPSDDLSTNADLWRALSRRVLAEPVCYRKAFSVEPALTPDQGTLLNKQRSASEGQLKQFADGQMDDVGHAQLESLLEFLPAADDLRDYDRAQLRRAAHGVLGSWLYHHQDYRSAIIELDQALTGSVCSEFVMNRGLALAAIGDRKRAKADLETLEQKVNWCSASAFVRQGWQQSVKAALAQLRSSPD